MKRSQSYQPMAQINVVPYIDVMLVLLIIFMITAPLLTQGVEVELPQTDARALTQEQQNPLVISVDEAGLYYLNVSDTPDVPIAANDLSVIVAAELTLAPGRSVMVRGDQLVSYGKVVVVMTLLQQAGAEQVGLITSTPSDVQQTG